MTDIDLTAAIRPTSDAIYRQLSGQYGDFSTPSDEEAEAVLKAALPHILAQVEARVKPDRLDVMPTRDEIARIIWTAMEGGETEGRTDGPLDWDYAAADAVLALFNGKTEQEVREEVAAEIEARANTHIELADRFGGYYQGMRSGLQEAAKLARGGEKA